MSKITLELPDGKKAEYIHAYGITYNATVKNHFPDGDLKSHIEDIRRLEIRDDDIYLATYPKCGTHWVWEILVMLKRGNAVYETKVKEAAFLDFRSPDQVKNIPSPRVLNCHYPCKLAPKGIFKKEIKIVHVMRNPKDAFVSFYHHHKHFNSGSFISFGDYLPQMIGEYGIYQFYPWFQYVKEWERFTKAHPEQILNLFYEDLKEDPVREIKKINSFLGTDRSDDLILDIAKACDFHNLKKADAEVKVKESFMKDDGRPSPMYRKGQVGDWKNHFTVAQNEKVDEWLADNLIDTDLKFRYTL
ncbi:sulfotransferase 1A1-like isoform X2 [Mercenaria mercenaria]|uniref:sulfotransferase 1A1-like isoform X2 n=1 Tax=Mercenaria mercenaria TaxID=6596 RepID=UPI001E1DE3A4|nr:sulfotransferase 1A1-like isoform X2 [Mercenaria mercenaria]